MHLTKCPLIFLVPTWYCTESLQGQLLTYHLFCDLFSVAFTVEGESKGPLFIFVSGWKCATSSREIIYDLFSKVGVKERTRSVMAL